MTNFGALAILAALPESAPVSDLRLLIALETVPAGPGGARVIGMRLLASKAGVPYSTARRARDRLAGRGLVAHTAGSGRGKVSAWQILLSLKVPAYGEHLSAVPSEPERCSPEPLKVLTCTSKGAHRNAVTCENENTGLGTYGLEPYGLNPYPSGGRDVSTATFDDFWNAYPRHVGKIKARAAWDKAIKVAGPAEILDGARRYAADPNRVDQYTAHPTTWLNQGRWDDDPLPARRAAVNPRMIPPGQFDAALARAHARDAAESRAAIR